MPGVRQPKKLVRLGHGRYGIAGHRESCNGNSVIGIRMREGEYRIVRSCACGAERRFAPGGYATLAEAEAVLGPGWWRR